MTYPLGSNEFTHWCVCGKPAVLKMLSDSLYNFIVHAKYCHCHAMSYVYYYNILNNCSTSVQLDSPPDLILDLLVMPTIQWMTVMHPREKGQLGTK